MAAHAATLALSLARRLNQRAGELEENLLPRGTATDHGGYATGVTNEANLGSLLLRSFPHSVAKHLGCSQRLLASWRSGEHRPSPRWRAVVETQLGIASSAWDRPLAASPVASAALSREAVKTAEKRAKTPAL